MFFLQKNCFFLSIWLARYKDNSLEIVGVPQTCIYLQEGEMSFFIEGKGQLS
jgi:hypothetical protein